MAIIMINEYYYINGFFFKVKHFFAFFFQMAEYILSEKKNRFTKEFPIRM